MFGFENNVGIAVELVLPPGKSKAVCAIGPGFAAVIFLAKYFPGY